MIAILAAISIVAYSGIQRRAINAAIASSASEAVKPINTAYAVNGQLDAGIVETNALCVGTTQNYPETDNLDEEYCYVNSAIPNVSLSEWIGSIGTIHVPTYEIGPNSLGLLPKRASVRH